MLTPPDPVLKAAVRWLQRLPSSGAARCRALFTTHREFSDITPTQYDAAYTWLATRGLLSDLGSTTPPERRIFESAIAQDGAIWFADADTLVRDPSELPADALRAANTLQISPDEAFAFVYAAWGKVDTAQRERIGAAGEAALVELLSRHLDARVRHVAAESDGFGYDIAVEVTPQPVHLEAKSTTRRGRLSVYLSRNEYETMLRDSAWQMVAIRLTPELEPAAFATVSKDWIADQAPADQGALGRWESCRLDVPPAALEDGIPVLQPNLRKDPPTLLTGLTSWPG